MPFFVYTLLTVKKLLSHLQTLRCLFWSHLDIVVFFFMFLFEKEEVMPHNK